MTPKLPRIKTKSIELRCKDGGYKTFTKFTRVNAMKCMCVECMGWETDPKDCTSPHCPLFPWRRRTQMTLKGDKAD